MFRSSLPRYSVPSPAARLVRAVPRPATLALAAAVTVVGLAGGVAAADAAVPGCTVMNSAGHARYTSLPTAVSNASAGATLLVAGTCTTIDTIISQNLTITALFGPRSATLTGSGTGTVLDISRTATVTLNGLTITGGSASLADGSEGGGIENAGTLTLNNTAVTGNTAPDGLGGGIFSVGELIIGGRSSVTGNTANGNGLGGGIYNTGTVTIDGQASVTGNTAYDGGGILNTGSSKGGQGGSAGGTLLIDGQASVSHNTASGEDGEGGGISNVSGTVTISGQARVSGNTASGDDSLGGGIYSEIIPAAVTLSGLASVSLNTAEYGGGIYNAADSALSLGERATVSFNTARGGADSGGGIYENDLGTVTGVHAGFFGDVFGNKPDNIN